DLSGVGRRANTRNVIEEGALEEARELLRCWRAGDCPEGRSGGILVSATLVETRNGELRPAHWANATDGQQVAEATERALSLVTELQRLMGTTLRSRSTSELDRALERLMNRLHLR